MNGTDRFLADSMARELDCLQEFRADERARRMEEAPPPHGGCVLIGTAGRLNTLAEVLAVAAGHVTGAVDLCQLEATDSRTRELLHQVERLTAQMRGWAGQVVEEVRRVQARA